MKVFQGTFRTGNFPLHRLEAFSDGIFAIVATLLILEIRIPHILGTDISKELTRGLFHLLPKFLSYVMSFGYISIYWVNHHQLFHLIKRADRGLFWLNSLFLMCLAFIPFPTALIGEYPHEYAAVMFYGVVMLVIAGSFLWMKWYVHKVEGLVASDIREDLIRLSILKVWVGPVLYLSAIVLSLFSTSVAIAIYVLIPVIYFFPGKGEKSLYS